MRTPYGLILIVFLVISGCQEVIFHDLAERDANRILVVLAREGIESTKSREGSTWIVSVSQSQVAKALAVLEEQRAVREIGLSPETTSSALVPSKEERQHQMERQVAHALENTLETLPGVLEARVHLNLKSNSRFGEANRAEGHTASVLLVARLASALDTSQVRHLVAGASGIKKEEVEVIVAEDENRLPTPAQAIAQPTNRLLSSITHQLCLGVGIGALAALTISWFLYLWRRDVLQADTDESSINDSPEIRLHMNGVADRPTELAGRLS